MRETNGQAPEETAVRQRLLVAALQLFISRGYAATTVREIVEAAGVSKPVLYYYFRSKEGIFLALIDGIRAAFNETVAEIITFPGSAQERIRHFCTRMFAAYHEHMDFVRFAYAVYFGPPQGAPECDLDYFFDRQLAIIADLIAEGVASGEFAPVPVQDASWSIIGVYNTVMEEQLCQAAPRVDLEGLQRQLTIVFNGIAQGVDR